MRRVKLSELFRVGSSKRVLQSQWTKHGVPFYRGREITKLAEDGFVNNELFISEELYSEYRSKNGVPKAGDIMVTAIGTIGNSYVVQPADRFYFKDASVLWLDRTTDISSKFIDYWLKSSLFFDQLDRGNGATVDTLTIQKLQGVEVNIPSRAEQERIVVILEEAFEGIATATANAEKSLQHARELLNVLTSQAFAELKESQGSRAFGTVCRFENGDRGKNYPGKEHRVARGVPFINAGHLTPQGVDFSEMDYISPERFSLLGNGKIQPQDVLFCLRGSLGKFASVGSLSCGAIASSLVILRPTHELDHGYLLCFLGSTLCKEQIDAYKGGAAQPNLGAKDLKRFELPIPSLEVQRQVANRLTECQERVTELMDSINQKLAALGALKKSLLHQAFTGQL